MHDATRRRLQKDYCAVASYLEVRSSAPLYTSALSAGSRSGGLAKLQGFTENDMLMKIIGAHIRASSTADDIVLLPRRSARIVSDASNYDMLRER